MAGWQPFTGNVQHATDTTRDQSLQSAAHCEPARLFVLSDYSNFFKELSSSAVVDAKLRAFLP